MLVTSLNLVKAYSGWGWAGGYLWHLKEVMVASGRFTVRGSGDGNASFAYNGTTAPLAAPDQGSGGAYDCWKTPKFTDMTVMVAGATNISSWVVMDEVGTARQYLFQTTNQSAGGWDGYGRVAYNAGGGATPAFTGGSASATALPGAATNEQWIFGSSRASATGQPIGLLSVTSGYVHVFCDSVAENNATGFGWFTGSDSRVVGGFMACPTVGGPAWDLDCLVIYSGASFSTIQTWNQIGYGAAAWGTASVGQRAIYNGGGSTRDTDGSAAIRQMGFTTGSAANLYFKGFSGRSVGYAVAKWLYPTLVQDIDGNRWVPASNGIMIPWPPTNPVVLPR
jgi:hypothetical protein